MPKGLRWPNGCRVPIPVSYHLLTESVHVLWIIPKQKRKIISGQTLLLTNWFKDIASPVDTPLLHHVADQLLIFDAVYMLQAQRKGIDNYRCQQKIM
uniref:(California timema) hypothetical protein n=1 Tax=Timema californicum TaxID=61474 RepID=A0A7R9PB97_TIMCA|nr:unnamed protein product [Timema californicum]